MPTAYLTRSAADTLATGMTGLVSWSGASNGAKDNALLLASLLVDSLRFQGRKYTDDGTQEREFPRVPDSDPHTPGLTATPRPPFDVVWDWDSGTSAAVVPDAVKRAVVYQADALLTAGARDERLDLQHDGVVYTSTGTQAESYKDFKGQGKAAGGITSICRLAWLLLKPYLRRSGRIV